MALMGDGEVHNMVVGMAPPPELEAHAPLPPLDEHHPLADVVDLKDLREVPEKKLDQIAPMQNGCTGLSDHIAPPPRALPKHCRQALENAEHCRHNKPPSQCHECARCPHGKQRQECKDCNSNSRRWCPHNKRKHDCKECSGCPHNRVRRYCKDCNGSGVCLHGRPRKNCRDCTRASDEKCEHFRPSKSWKECSAGGVNGVGMPPDHGSMMVPDVRLPALAPPVPLDGAEGHEALAALDEQHKHMSADDGSGLHDPSVGMQVLSVDQVSTSGVVALKLVRAHDPGAVAAGLMELGVVSTGDDGSSALPALRLCAHGKSSRNECDECIKAIALQMHSMPNALEQESGKKRPRDDLAGCSKGETADIMKTASVALASCTTSELLSPHTTAWHEEETHRCKHNKVKNKCRECAVCEAHGRLRHDCRDCNAGSRRWCVHSKRKHDCKECSGCPHNKVKRCCKECNGSAVCAHGRLRKNCRDCKVPGLDRKISPQ